MTAETPEPADQLPVGNVVDSFIAVVIFIATNKLAGLPWAIGAVTLWSLRAIYVRWRKGLGIGVLLPVVTAGILVRGIIGIITSSEAVYFGLGIAGKATVGVAIIGSAVIGKNLLARFAPLVFGFDSATVAHPAYRRAMNRVAWVAGVAQLGSAAFDVWLYRNSSVNGYVLIRFLVNWPYTTIILLGCMWYLSRALATIAGFPGIGVVMERHMARYERSRRACR
jgi:hypothetical protein